MHVKMKEWLSSKYSTHCGFYRNTLPWYSKRLDIVNKRGLTGSFTISSLGCIISLVSFAGIISELKAFLSRHDLGSYIKWKIEKYIAKIPIFSYQTLDSAPLIDNGWWFSNCNNLWLKPMETLLKFAAAAIVQIEVSLLSRVECCRCVAGWL